MDEQGALLGADVRNKRLTEMKQVQCERMMPP